MPTALDLFGYVELSLLEAMLESSWGYYIRHQFNTWFDEPSQAQLYLFHHESHPRLADVPLVYFASDRPIASYSGDRRGFLGHGRTKRNPQAVERREGDTPRPDGRIRLRDHAAKYVPSQPHTMLLRRGRQ